MKLKNLRHVPNLYRDHIHSLPLVVLYLTDGCNSKCAMCDIWRAPRVNMAMELVDQLVADCRRLHTNTVLLSGGEAMQHPQWAAIAQKFRAQGIKVWLLTNGLLLKKQATQVMASVDAVTVSLDAATTELYEQIRGVDALEVVLAGMQAVSNGGIPVSTRTTLMHANYQQMPQIVDTALAHGARSVSFLAVDTVNPYAFGDRFNADVIIPVLDNPYGGLTMDDLPQFKAIIDQLSISHADYFTDGRIEESPAKLRRLYDFFAAPHDLGTFAPPRCNAPHLSAVVNVDGTLQPCYFLPEGGRVTVEQGLIEVLNSPTMVALRAAYRQGERAECARCVCPLYRDARGLLNF